MAIAVFASPSAAVAAPPNDNFANAEVISGTLDAVDGTNVDATKETGEPNHAGNPGGKSVWYSWTAPGNGTVTVATCTSNFDTLLAVYTGDVVSGLTDVGSNDDDPPPCGSGRSTVTVPVTTGQTYRIAVDGKDGAQGSLTVSLSFTEGAPPPPPPDGGGGLGGQPEADCSASSKRYTGTTGQGEKICFTRNGSKVVGLAFTIHASCTSGDLTQYNEFTKPLTASRSHRNPKVRKFSFSDEEIEVRGRIKGSKAKGTLELAGSTVAGLCNSGLVSWDAHKG